MKGFQQMVNHPAGRWGLTIGLTVGLLAAIMGGTSKALLFVGLCRFLAQRSVRHS